MKAGIIITTDDHDTCFLAIRYAIFNLMEKKDVGIYFVDSGLSFDKSHDTTYKLSELAQDFEQAGGKIHRAHNRDALKECLARNFSRWVNARQIDSICFNDNFQSIMTKDIYIRKFTKASARG